jgi:hypothetical protein
MIYKDRKLLMVALTGLLVFGLVGCGAPTEEKSAKTPDEEQPKEILEVLSAEEMIKLMPDSWPGDWTLFMPSYMPEPVILEALAGEGGILLPLGKGKGPLQQAAQKVRITINDVQDLNAERDFEPIDETQKTPTGTVIMEAITLKGHKAQISKVPEMMNTMILEFYSGRFNIEATGVGDEGTTLDDLKALCGALKLPKQ